MSVVFAGQVRAAGGSGDSLQEAGTDTLREDFLELQNTVKAIDARVSGLEQKDEMQRLMDEAGRLSSREESHQVDISRKYFSGARQQQGINPNISFGMDFFGEFRSPDSGEGDRPEGLDYGDNGIFLREAELSLVAPLDPFARGKAFLAASPHGVEVDEAYIEWLNLPLNATLKTGIFRSEFGLLNRYHDHALPQFDRPRALVNLFGLEGLGGPGVAANFMLPAFMAHATSLDLSLVYNGVPMSFKPDSAPGFIYTGQFLNYYDLSAASYLEIRLSGAFGRNANPEGSFSTAVGSAGITYKWTPPGREKYRTVDWKTEFFLSSQGYEGGNHRSLGFYSSLQCKLGARFWVSGRAGYSELPYDPSLYDWDFTLALDFWQSEFVLTRLQYQFNERGLKYHSLVLQVVWAMGPHKHEAY